MVLVGCDERWRFWIYLVVLYEGGLVLVLVLALVRGPSGLAGSRYRHSFPSNCLLSDGITCVHIFVVDVHYHTIPGILLLFGCVIHMSAI